MAQPLCPLVSESWMLAADWSPAPPEIDRGCSPSSSQDSWGRAPAGIPVQSAARSRVRPGSSTSAAGRRNSRPGSGARQSASEREKLRMRTLARALHQLRCFLPASVAPAGQSLTKIETLRLAILYIDHLSAMLGLGEDGLQRRRRRRRDAGSPRGCLLCPAGGPGPARPAPRAAPEPCEAQSPHALVGMPRPSARLFPGHQEALALLETWVPLSPPEWLRPGEAKGQRTPGALSEHQGLFGALHL